MKVFHVINHLRMGVGRYLADLAMEQTRGLGYEVKVFTSNDVDDTFRSDPGIADELENAGVETKVVGDVFHRKLESLSGGASGLAEHLPQDREDVVVHAHGSMAAAAARFAGAKTLVCTCHGWSMDRPEEFDLQDAMAYQMCDVVTTPSQFWADRLANLFHRADTRVIPVGVNLDNFPTHHEHRKRPGDPLKIVTVCELTKRKGVDILINAMPYVWGSVERCELHIIGGGEMERALKARAMDMTGAGPRIVFHGEVQFPYERLGEFDLFCLASRSDTMPVAMIEAMLAGMPVVGTDVGGIREMVESAGCGAVAQPESPENLALAIVSVISSDDMLKMGTLANSYARNAFGIKNIAARLDDVYHNAINKPSQ